MFCNSGCCQQMFNFVKTVFVAFIVKSTTFGPLVHLAAHWHSAEVFIDVHENYQKKPAQQIQNIRAQWHHHPIHSFRKGQTPTAEHQRCKNISYDQPWPRLHKETLRSCYGSAPFF